MLGHPNTKTKLKSNSIILINTTAFQIIIFTRIRVQLPFLDQRSPSTNVFSAVLPTVLVFYQDTNEG
jgi:hypothetical protein